jgi:hypothetical protein
MARGGVNSLFKILQASLDNHVSIKDGYANSSTSSLHYASHLYNSSEARQRSLIHTNKAKSLSYLLLCDKSYTK